MFKLFNREEKYLHDITPLKAINKEVLNGEDTLTSTINSGINIEKKYRVLIKIKKYNIWKEYIVEEIDEDRTDGFKEIYLENSLYETIGDYIEDKRAINTTANIALARALETSRWEVGIVENLGIGTATFYRTNVKQAIQDICKEWKAELRTRIVISGNKIIHRYVDLLAKRGNFLGERFVNGDNINKIKRTINTDPIVTALYGYGKGEEVGEGYGRRIDFSSINNGKAYIEDNEARLKWGRLNKDGTKAHIFGKREYDDIEDLQELKDATTEDLELLKDPSVTYEMEIEVAVAQLGDTVIIVDTENEPNLRLTARVYEIESDLLDESNSKPILGNYRRDITDSMNKQEEYIDNFRNKQGIWDRADSFDKEGNLNTQYLNGVIDVLKNKLLSTMSGWYTDDNGNIVLDAKDGSSSMMLSGAGFMIANSKDATDNWNYRTFGTGNGFVADEIITGILKGGKVKFDLTNGTFLIGNSINDYNLLFDGTNLNIGGNTSISWDNITNQPSIPTTPGDIGAKPDGWLPTWSEIQNQPTILSADDIKNTVVTKDWIATLGLLVGDEIKMGANAKITWSNVTNQPSIPNNASDVGALPEDWTPTWSQIKSKPTILSADDIKTTVITRDWIGTLGLLVGDQIQMGANAKISWSNVTGTTDVASKSDIPTTPEELGALPSWWKPTWTDVSGKPSIPTKPSDIGAKPDVWVPTWNDVTGKPYIPTENYITNITKDTITTSYINALGVRAKSLLAGTINIGNNAFQVDVDGWLHAGRGGFSVPPDANGIFNAFTNVETGTEAARWKYDNATYIFQSKDSFRVYTRGTIAMELLRLDSHGHTGIRLMSWRENGALIKALGIDKDNEQVQFRSVYDNYFIEVAASNFKVASSAKIKKDITYCKSKLELVKNTPVFNFRLKDDKSEEMNTGFIVESSPKEITTKLGDEDGISIVDTLATLWKAVQELNAKVEKLEGRNNGVRR